jgi:hypothetical protein
MVLSEVKKGNQSKGVTMNRECLSQPMARCYSVKT